MSRSDRKRSYSPERRRRRSPSRSRSPHRRRHRSPERQRRPSPDYERYHKKQSSSRKPAWIDGDISEDDIRDQAQGDPIEFRRLKRWKLNERGVRGFWHNTPTPSPSPTRENRRHTNGTNQAEKEVTALDSSNPAADPAEDPSIASAAQGLQAEIMAAGPEIAELHQKAAQLFQEWLTEEKAAQAEAEKRRKQEALDNVLVGPVPEFTEKAAADYGTHMRPGEGTAMAAYVQSGKRIPRRGEVGMSADEIVKYEDLGYVMSGSRHNRMNAIRIRKENQVYTAEEKAALAMFNAEENKRKEQKILADMQRLVQRTIGGIQDTGDDDSG